MDKRLEELIRFMTERGITDLHLEKDNLMKIEGRNGRLWSRVPVQEGDEQLFSYLKYLSDMDLSDGSRPQSGSFEYRMAGKTYSFRFAYLSARGQRSAVLRIMNCRDAVPLERMFMKGEQRSMIRSWCQRENGLIVLSGPTGAGKTTAAYSLLASMKDKKIYSLEDPVEVYQKGIVQIQVNAAAGLDYAAGIRQLLRHDPDVVMIGEIRDEDTARMTLRCALTGHLVITTLHASSCRASLLRMMELGLSAMDLEDVLAGITNQRLVDLDHPGARGCIFEMADPAMIRKMLHQEHTEGGLYKEMEYAVRKKWITAEEARKYGG